MPTPQLSTCDECRRRKLKCIGVPPSFCDRCQRENIRCVYSSRKQMGRPRKRHREENTHSSHNELVGCETVGELPTWTSSSSERDVAGQLEGIPLVTENNDLSWVTDFEQGPPNLETQLDAWNHIDPALADTSSNIIPQSISLPATSCSCLPTYYLAAAELPETSRFGFPAALPPLKSALASAQTMVCCDKCPQEATSYKQNVMLLISLLDTIASSFQKLLHSIDRQTEDAKASGAKLVLPMGDMSPVNAHRHTGTDDCPMRLELELDPEEWRALTKRVVGKSVYDKGGAARTLEGLLNKTEQRHDVWHASPIARKSYGCHEDHQEVSDCCIFRLTKDIRYQIKHFNF